MGVREFDDFEKYDSIIFKDLDELEEEIDFKRGGNLREQRDALRAKHEAMHGEIAELIEDAMRKEPGAHSPVGDDDSGWNGIWPLWDYKWPQPQ